MQIAMTTAAMITDAGGQTVKGTPPDGGGEGGVERGIPRLLLNS